jgi:hypothetical protein
VDQVEELQTPVAVRQASGPKRGIKKPAPWQTLSWESHAAEYEARGEISIILNRFFGP